MSEGDILLETWREIDGFPGYEVSSKGRIRSYKDYHGRITNHYRILVQRVNSNGYAIVTLYGDDHRPKQLSVHRLVAQAFIPTNDNNLYIDHLDNDKLNNSVLNLEWVTPRENSIRAIADGLYSSVLAATRRPVIITDLRTGEELYFDGVNDAARHLKYSSSVISRVANGLQDTFGHYTAEFAGNEEILLFSKYC